MSFPSLRLLLSLLVLISSFSLKASHFHNGHISARFIGDSSNHRFELSLMLPEKWALDLLAFGNNKVKIRLVQNGSEIGHTFVQAQYPVSGNTIFAAPGTSNELWKIPAPYGCSGYSTLDSAYGLAIWMGTIDLPGPGLYTLEYWGPAGAAID